MYLLTQIGSHKLAVLKPEFTPESPGGCDNTDHSVSDSVGLGRGPGTGVSHKSPGVLLLLVQMPHFANCRSRGRRVQYYKETSLIPTAAPAGLLGVCMLCGVLFVCSFQ